MNKEKLALQSWDDVEASLGEISQLKAERDKQVAVLKSSIAFLNIEMDEKTVNLDFGIRQHEQNILLFARAHIDEIRKEKKKSKQFITGIVKTKEEDKYIYPSDEDLVETIKLLGLEDDLIKIIEKPIKPVIKARVKRNPELLEELEIEVNSEPSIIINAF
jgi:phage host-nuclease inhibitor protein Gam